jgi:glycerophosphoryl diester phosphodiesterase
LLRRAWQDCLHAWKPLTGYMAWFAALNLALLTPMTAWLLEWIVRGSGDVAISNHDLAGFALSLRGALFLIVTIALYLAVLQVEVGGLTLLAAQAADRGSVSLWQVIRKSTARLPAFLRLSLIQAGAVLGLVGLLTAVLAGIKAGLLSGHDINYYLTETPPNWWTALALASTTVLIGATLLVWLVIRWLFSVPVLLLENTRARRALRTSWGVTRGQEIRIGLPLAAWWGGTAAIWAGLASLGRLLLEPAFGWAGLSPARVLPLVASSVVVTAIVATAWSIVTLGVHQFAVTRLAMRLCRLTCRNATPAASHRRTSSHLSSDSGPRSSTRLTSLAWLSMLGLLLASALTGWTMMRNLNLVESVAITAHRGSSIKAPENTLAAIHQAMTDGADYIEIDVQTCADGAIVVIHDRDLMRVGGDPRRVQDLTLAEIRRVDVGRRFSGEFTGEQVPTLTEVIEAVRDQVKLNIELKYNRPDPALVPAVVKVLRRENFLNQCVVTSLNAAALSEFRKLEAAPPIGLIVTAAIGRISRVEQDFLSVAAPRATPAAIREAHRANKQVHVWTVNDPQIMLQMIENGVDNLITDRPDLLRTVLDERAQLSDPEKVALRLRILFGGGAPIGSSGTWQQ